MVGAMARQPRLQIPGGIYHVTGRGNRREPIFLDEVDYERFVAILGDVVERRRWRIYSYCLLPNHFHVVVETLEPNLAIGMHRVNGVYARWFNRRHGFVGHVFQRRYYARMVESDWHLIELARYVSRNPVSAGLCRHPAEWPWSSYCAIAGTAASPPFVDAGRVLAFFGPSSEVGRRAFTEFVCSDRPGHVLVPGTLDVAV
jgi:putative transposase